MNNENVAAEKIQITVWKCNCERCGHLWESRKTNKPKCCPACKSPYWETKRVRVFRA